MDHSITLGAGPGFSLETNIYSNKYRYTLSLTVHPRAWAPSTIAATAAPNDGAVVTPFRGADAFIGFHDFGGRNPI